MLFRSRKNRVNLVHSVFPEAPDSVHLADFPVADMTKIDKQLVADTQLVIKVSSLGRAERSKAGIKVRQPLAEVEVSVADSKEQESLERLKSQILEELNVKNVKIIVPTAHLHLHTYPPSVSVVISTEISPELQLEGMAREIVHRLQVMRRSAGFDIADYITTYYQGDDYIQQVMTDIANYIKQETLSRELIKFTEETELEVVIGRLAGDVFTERYKLGGHEILLGVKRLD